MDANTTLLAYLPGIAAVLVLAYSVYKDYMLRKEEVYLNAVSSLSDGAASIRTASVLALKSLIAPTALRRSARRRQETIAHILATQILEEEDPFVRSLCSRALSEANFYTRYHATRYLYELNLIAWARRNAACIKNNASLDRNEEALRANSQALASILKRWRLRALNLRGVHLDFTNLTGANLRRCNMTEATLTHADFTKASFKRTRLDRAIITHSYFRGTSLRKASFENAVVCYCRFSKVAGSDPLNHARILLNNTYRDTPPPPRELKHRDSPTEVFRTTELDWVGIWASTQDEHVLSAEWRSPHSDELVTAKMRRTPSSEENFTLLRTESSDKNDGEYRIHQIAQMPVPDAHFINGERQLVADKQPWSAVRWTFLSSPRHD